MGRGVVELRKGTFGDDVEDMRTGVGGHQDARAGE